MGATVGATPYHSRFQVLTSGETAWAVDGKGTLYRFDGFYFDRRRHRDRSFSIVPSWQTPPHGWLLTSDCACSVWFVAPAKILPASRTTSPDVAA